MAILIIIIIGIIIKSLKSSSKASLAGSHQHDNHNDEQHEAAVWLGFTATLAILGFFFFEKVGSRIIMMNYCGDGDDDDTDDNDDSNGNDDMWLGFTATVAILGFLDTHVSLAPTHVCLFVRKSVGDSFGFPICQRLWSPYVKS